MRRSFSFRRRSIAATLLMLGGLALFVVLAFIGHHSLRTVDAATELRSRARANELQAERVMSALKDVETGQRGFVLTGDEEYLDPFGRGLTELAESLRPLQAEFALLFGELQRDTLATLIDRRVALAERNVAARRQGMLEPDLQKTMLDEGRMTMQLIRERFDEVEAHLAREVEQREHEALRLKRRALWWAVLLPVSGVLLIVAAYVLLQREQARRQRAEHALRDANLQLEDAVAQRTAELQQALGQIETFAAHLDSSVEAERRRLAREVHDQLGQVFTSLKMTVHQVFKDSPQHAAEFERINALLGEGIATARRIAGALRPPLLDDLGLGAALSHAARQFGEQAGVRCEVRVEDSECLTAEQAIQLYRIAQEALTNVARHAAASRVWIEGALTEGRYHLAIEDDGRGMQAASGASLGTLSMRERASLAGGELRFEGGRDGGVRVQVSLPVNEGSLAHDACPDHR
ncbi:CHASE3 domain-containing protein [Thauera sp. WH-1]|uniref:CHASE3 domain-containing protein n=1 Tax=Thauera sp. WH-1 TaxID=3398230 RepID=UPI0039FD14B1